MVLSMIPLPDRLHRILGLQEMHTGHRTAQGWPMLVLDLHEAHQPRFGALGGQISPLAYGVVPMPCSSGLHHLTCMVMRVLPRNDSTSAAGMQPHRTANHDMCATT
jgi:hypothetical protein